MEEEEVDLDEEEEVPWEVGYHAGQGDGEEGEEIPMKVQLRLGFYGR